MKFSAVILSGGRATRLNGVDKGLYLFQEKPLISYVLNRLKPFVSDIVISANRSIDEYQNFGYHVVSDGNADYEGPLKGLSEALDVCQQDKVLVTTCDMPFLPDNLLSLFNNKSESKIQIISVAQRMQLCFLMDKDLLASLNTYLSSGGKRVMQWIKSNNYSEIEYSGSESHFKNFNRPEDFS